MSSGYSGIPLIKKLGIKPSFRVAFVHQPQNYLPLLGDLPPDVSIHPLTEHNLHFVHAFYIDKAKLQAEFNTLKSAISRHGMVWISWYKKAAKMTTDLTSDIVRGIGLEGGLVDVKVAAIDAQWSGLKFVYRVEDR